MRGFINTLVLTVECHTGGAAVQSNSLLFMRRRSPPRSDGGGAMEIGRLAPPTSSSDWEQVAPSQR